MNKTSSNPFADYRSRQRQTRRHAATYTNYADVSHLLAGRLMERLDLVQIAPEKVLDLNCADGFSTAKLEERFKKSRLIGLDIVDEQLRIASSNKGWFKKRRFVSGCEDNIPLATDSVDCIYSNLLPSWLVDPADIFTSCKRVINDNGLILFSTLGPDSLKELTQAWQAVDPNYQHCHQFIDMHDIGDALSRSGFSGIVMESEPLAIEYDAADELHADLRLTGNANLARSRRKSLLGKKRYQAYLDTLTNNQNKLTCTLEVVYGHAWAGYSKAKIPEHDFRPMATEIPTINVE